MSETVTEETILDQKRDDSGCTQEIDEDRINNAIEIPSFLTNSYYFNSQPKHHPLTKGLKTP